MAQSLGNDDDIRKTTSSMESSGESFFLSIPDAKTPWYLLGLEYTQYFQHWYDAGQGRRSVVCAGGVDGHGFATDDCPICAHVLELYQEGKRLREDGDEVRGNKLKERGSKLRAKGTVLLKAIRGMYLIERDPKTKKKRQIADFTIDPEDEDNSVEVGLLALTEAQWVGLTGLRNGEHTPFIKNGKDLVNRVLYTKKVRRKGKTSKYTAVEWGAEEEETEMPDVEIPEELANLDTDDYAKIDIDEVEKVAALLTGAGSEEPEDDEEVALDDDSEEDVDEGYLDDVEDDNDEEAEEFEDDLLDDEEESNPTPRKVADTHSRSGKSSGTKKGHSSSARSGKASSSKRSGKTRL